MKRNKSILSVLIALCMVFTMMAGAISASADYGDLTYADGTVLRMATGYNSA